MSIGSTDDAQSIVLSDQERLEGKYSPETLAKVLGALHQDGLVVLKNVIPVETIDKINTWMCDDADRRIRDPTQAYNHGIKSNILQRPPLTEPELLSKDVYFNPFVLQTANAYLGHRPIWNWMTANNALANTGGTRQPPHKDSSFDHPLYPYFFIANIPLCDFSIENGSTEFWLGSHSHTTQAEQKVAETEEDLASYPGLTEIGGIIPPISEEAKEERRKIRPPIQPACGRGDVMIRDLRLWHAGMPNHSNAHRVMLGLGYMSPHHPNYYLKVHLPSSQEKFFLGNGRPDVEVRAQWYSDEDLAKVTEDVNFYTKPAYLEKK
ncbi:phytanoyl-dioxygenase family protein [Microdochium bolleyi]|uniref:Phytanoyl-dioxygenase family protein n=1 Tax=Microdochium bolleyi TaxID=196109 RepID=A0A136INJ2_9PEZI|nr:phytanoyl-dioxygenase family protein [Microdochium bolleyi]